MIPPIISSTTSARWLQTFVVSMSSLLEVSPLLFHLLAMASIWLAMRVMPVKLMNKKNINRN
jgi:hypothetical protein